MTFSIVARDPETGALGVAVASRFPAAGAVVPSVRAGVGAIASQAFANVRYGPEGLELLGDGSSPEDVVARLTATDALGAHRQLAVVDARGAAAASTGSSCIAWCGHRVGEGVSVQGNILAGPQVIDVMFEAWNAGSGAGARFAPFARRLVAALRAGDEAGGDLRGRQSAGVVIALDDASGVCPPDRWLDLRVDDHVAPIDELERLLDVMALVFGSPDEANLVPITDALAAEVAAQLARVDLPLDNPPVGITDELEPRALMGTPRPGPERWDANLERRFHAWLALDNLDARRVAAGWIDPLVLERLRNR